MEFLEEPFLQLCEKGGQSTEPGATWRSSVGFSGMGAGEAVFYLHICKTRLNAACAGGAVTIEKSNVLLIRSVA
ncbi:hypothetical protein M1B72_17685 [Geomonas paludis]|uniref:Uncharacterized protein n=1 Tax=Geomonas paludis TaxID=2740185 RepID=A0ABY4LB99_9BACT|nr:hypothetical protein [Geomonas paludis]UPU35256.1 hypothetical protein M1B72_17685 [Geomonas paludis]